MVSELYINVRRRQLKGIIERRTKHNQFIVFFFSVFFFTDTRENVRKTGFRVVSNKTGALFSVYLNAGVSFNWLLKSNTKN